MKKYATFLVILAILGIFLTGCSEAGAVKTDEVPIGVLSEPATELVEMDAPEEASIATITESLVSENLVSGNSTTEKLVGPVKINAGAATMEDLAVSAKPTADKNAAAESDATTVANAGLEPEAPQESALVQSNGSAVTGAEAQSEQISEPVAENNSTPAESADEPKSSSDSAVEEIPPDTPLPDLAYRAPDDFDPETYVFPEESLRPKVEEPYTGPDIGQDVPDDIWLGPPKD